jgi:8-oxo-dGTP pyrophosphatase MutT (NUDIX family)
MAQQAAAIPVRRSGKSVQVCLIRRKGSRTWGIPKGMVEAGDTHQETALNEAWEEAGLEGRLVGDSLGTYQYDKWDDVLEVKVFLMEVVEEHDEWQEAHLRERRWTSFGEAAVMLDGHPARPLLDIARERVAHRHG